MIGSLWFNSFSSGAGASADYELISTTVLGSAQASVTFTDAGAWTPYKHLQIRAVTLKTGQEWAGIQFNGDTNGSNYYFNHRLEGNGSSAVSGANASVGGFSGASWFYQFGTNPNAVITDILDFSSTTKNKTVRTFSGVATSRVALESSLWMSTSAITSITLKNIDNANWLTGSRFSLYGLKG